MEEQETLTKSEMQELLFIAFLFMGAGILLQSGTGVGVSDGQVLRSELGFIIFGFGAFLFGVRAGIKSETEKKVV